VKVTGYWVQLQWQRFSVTKGIKKQKMSTKKKRKKKKKEKQQKEPIKSDESQL